MGDLRYGVRDARMKAKEKNWPRVDSIAYLQKKDRSSWIASSFLKSFQSQAKGKEKRNYMRLAKYSLVMLVLSLMLKQ